MQNLVGKSPEKHVLRRLKRVWDDNMKMDLMADFRISRVGTSVSASTTSAVSISLYRSL